jgi:hypothetical protein
MQCHKSSKHIRVYVKEISVKNWMEFGWVLDGLDAFLNLTAFINLNFWRKTKWLTFSLRKVFLDF